MMFLTAKVDLKKILIVLAVLAGVILGILWISGDNSQETAGGAPLNTNEGRVQFLADLGWKAAASPVESTQVKIPEQMSEVFSRYNALQLSQGYDLSKYAGKQVMRYVYRIDNYPGAAEPVYATILMYKNQVIGGDITDTTPGGKIQGLKAVNSTAPTETKKVE